jgi:hypothetical protein
VKPFIVYVHVMLYGNSDFVSNLYSEFATLLEDINKMLRVSSTFLFDLDESRYRKYLR